MAELTPAENILVVRRLINDTVEPFKIPDLDITTVLTLTGGDTFRTASLLAQSIGAQFSEYSDVDIGGAIKVELGTTAKNYMELAANLAGGGRAVGGKTIIPWEVPSIGGVMTGKTESTIPTILSEQDTFSE